MEFRWHLFVFAIILTASQVNAEGKCIQCDGPDCLYNPPTDTSKMCNNANECFTSVDSNGNVKRGCVSDAGEKCTEKNCRKCTASGETPCNNDKDEQSLFFCKTCDSTNNAQCVKTADSILQHICDKGVTRCLTQIKDKHTYRGCASSSSDDCPKDQKCSSCTSRGCNKEIFPSDRRQCYQCKSGGSNCGSPTSDMSAPCLLYEEQDTCYEYGTSDSTMARGCKSDSTDYGTCTSQKEKCKECSANGCNGDKFKTKPTIKCIQCTAENSKCTGAFTAEEAAECSTEIEYWEKQGCYTNRIEAGKVARGCAKDFDCAAASKTCTICNDSACNTAQNIELSCYKCRSDENTKCAQPLTTNEYNSEKCRNAVSSEENNKCYTENWNGIIIRSCLVDTDPKTRKNCLDEKFKTCEICSGDNCNKLKAPNSAYAITVATGLMTLSLLLLKFI